MRSSTAISATAVLAFGLTLPSALLATPSADRETLAFEEARMIANANEATPEWNGYFRPLFDQLGPVLSRTMMRCFPDDGQTPVDKISIVFAIEADGSLSSFMHRPKILELSCVIEGIRYVRVPTPPRPQWWTALEIKITP